MTEILTKPASVKGPAAWFTGEVCFGVAPALAWPRGYGPALDSYRTIAA